MKALKFVLIPIIVLLAIAGALFAGKKYLENKSVDSILSSISEAITDTIGNIGSDALENITGLDALDEISEEDKETVTEIVKNHIDDISVTDVVQMASSGDYDQLYNYAQEHLTEEEQTELEQIYEKYASSYSTEDLEALAESYQ